MKFYATVLVLGLILALNQAAPVSPEERQFDSIGQTFSTIAGIPASLASLFTPPVLPSFSALRTMMSSFFNFLPNLITDL
ncbi:Uncharacterized protein APZ42_011906 [Daphnia magna]|uniref:Uncharacterized protein n=1 Tax=Daphnia magna TaxID=35525 RepID=A0A162SE45_9CRUS|nr:Uncharacterized protein APZ42_011906 [Daphnia magna]